MVSSAFFRDQSLAFLLQKSTNQAQNTKNQSDLNLYRTWLPWFPKSASQLLLEKNPSAAQRNPRQGSPQDSSGSEEKIKLAPGLDAFPKLSINYNLLGQVMI